MSVGAHRDQRCQIAIGAGCELPDMVLGVELSSSGRTIYVLNH